MSTNTDTNTNTPQETASEPETTAKTEPEAAPVAEPQKAKPEAQTEALIAEELAEFRKYQESKKSEAEKHAAAISKAEKAKEAAEQRAAAAELKVTALAKGISAEALDDVIALAKTKISDKVTAEQAIEEIVTKYPSFSGNGGTTGTQTLNNHSSEEIDEAKARKIMGLPAAK